MYNRHTTWITLKIQMRNISRLVQFTRKHTRSAYTHNPDPTEDTNYIVVIKKKYSIFYSARVVSPSFFSAYVLKFNSGFPDYVKVRFGYIARFIFDGIKKKSRQWPSQRWHVPLHSIKFIKNLH